MPDELWETLQLLFMPFEITKLIPYIETISIYPQ